MKLRIINIFLLTAISTTIVAQSELLSYDQCQDMAQQHNKELAKARMQEEQIGYDMKTYKSNFYPRFNLMAFDMYSNAKGDFTITGGHLPIYNYVAASGKFVPNATMNSDGSYTLSQYADFPDQKMEFKLKNIIFGGISFTQPIYMGGKITTAYQMSRIGQDMARLNVALAKDEVIVNTAEAYFMAIKAKEMVEVAEKYKTLLKELMKNVESAVNHGLKTRNDMMKVQVKLNEADLNITKAQNGYRLAKMNLCHFIGKPLSSNIDVDSKSLNTPSTVLTDHNIDISNRKEYAILSKKVELAEKQVHITRSDYLPNVILMGGVTYSNGGELAGKKLMDNGSASIAVGVKIPLLTFGENTGKIRSAKSKQVIAQLEQEDLNETMILEQQQAINNLEEASKIVTLTTSALTQAEENMRLSKQQYEVGTETLSDYLEAQALWQNCYASKIDASCQYHLAHIKYLKTKGEL